MIAIGRAGPSIALVARVVARALACWLALSSLVGCDDEVVPAEEPACSRELVVSRPVIAPGRTDLLFVVDRTPSMADQAERLAANARLLGEVIATRFAPYDLHIGVVSSDLGGDGVPGCRSDGDAAQLLSAAGCGIDGAFMQTLPRDDASRIQNFDGALPDALACLLALPPSTCPVSQPLAAAARAVDGSATGNLGFRRANTQLAIIVVTDGDDCSMTARDALARAGLPLDREAAVDFACFARGLRCDPDLPHDPGEHRGCVARDDGGLADPRALLAASDAAAISVVSGGAIVSVDPGPQLSPVCDGAGPAPRLALAWLPERTFAADVCAEVWTDVFAYRQGPLLPATDLCLPADASPLRCAGTLTHADDARAVPWCDASHGPPCLRALETTLMCPDAVHIQLDRGDPRLPEPSVLELRCELPCDWIAAAR